MNLADVRPAAAAAGESLADARLGKPPARYTLGVHQQICDNVRRGNRPVTAAQMAGIPSSTFYHWMKLGKEGNPHLFQFAEDVEIAGGEAEGTALSAITTSFEDPENAKWYLERTRPAGYSKEVNSKVEAFINEFMDRLQDGLTPEMYAIVMGVAAGAGLPEAGPARFQLPPKKTEEIEDAVVVG